MGMAQSVIVAKNPARTRIFRHVVAMRYGAPECRIRTMAQRVLSRSTRVLELGFV